eukprot:1151826-Pelagomonas_calceolata.AAC.1
MHSHLEQSVEPEMTPVPGSSGRGKEYHSPDAVKNCWGVLRRLPAVPWRPSTALRNWSLSPLLLSAAKTRLPSHLVASTYRQELHVYGCIFKEISVTSSTGC